MIEIALTLMDYLIKLLQKREDSADEYFELYVSPAYDAAEAVFSDYLGLLTEIKKKIEQNEQPMQLIKFLEEGRVKYLPIRMRLRAEIRSRFGIPYHDEEYRSNILNKLPEFERGILGILMGGVAPFEDKVYNNTPYYKSHTLLDILYRFSSHAIACEDNSEYMRTVNKQIDALNKAWEDVVNGYAQYKKLVVPMPSDKTFVKPATPNSSVKKVFYKRQGD